MKMEPKIRFVDSLVIDQPADEKIVADAKKFVSDRDSKLVVKIDATHSGLLTNMRVYPGLKVARSYKTYFSKDKGGASEYDVPILKHHDATKSDPVGRVVYAEFLKLKSGEDFRKDFLHPDREGKGSGVVRVTAEITDSDTIEKILDGRLISVSSGHIARQMKCSICGDDLIPPLLKLFTGKESECDHVPGQEYKVDGQKRLCYGITGDLTYKELSFVNIPAQPSAKVVQSDWLALKDSEEPFIQTVMRAKKSSVTEMVLVDMDNNELNLLSAKANVPPKVVVAVSADAKEKLEQFICGDDEDDDSGVAEGVEPAHSADRSAPLSRHGGDDVQDDNGPEEHVSHEDHVPEESESESTQDPIIELDNTSKGEEEMEKEKLSVDELTASIKALTEKVEALEDKVKEYEAQVSELNSTIESKDSEIARITGDMAELTADTAKYLARCVASTRLLLKKPDTEEIKTSEDFEGYVESLSTRTISSLKDSLTDLAMELTLPLKEDESKEPESSSKQHIEDKAVTSPVSSGEKKTSKKTLDDLLS
ncbi:MAG: hypothetical protein D6732_00515 [Methanobacteriota archaeon]|nr:MAG: hypothetical protein D6732_00515 [Euryarchaeota archaeon]